MFYAFIGNCQTLALSYYLQQLVPNDTIFWCMYGNEFIQHLGNWTQKCKIIKNINEIYKYIQTCDVIIYQEIELKKSEFANDSTIKKIMKPTCKLIKMPSIHIDCNNYDVSIIELCKRETKNNVDIKVSDLITKYKTNNRLMLTMVHPTTFLFLEVLKEICIILNISFFSEKQYLYFMTDSNYMKLH